MNLGIAFRGLKLFFKIAIIFYVLLGCCFIATVIGVRYFYGNIDIALMLQHIQLIKTADLSVFQGAICLGVGVTIFTTLLILRWRIIGIPILTVALGYLIIPEIDFTFFITQNDSIYQKYYIIPKLKAPKKPKNIIWISLESIEELFADSKITRTESLIPNLKELQKYGTNFQGWNHVHLYMEPTLPSYVATNCGIPRKIRLNSQFRNSVQSIPSAICVSDLLKKNGYDTTFIMGGHIEDENANQFVGAHPYTTVMGRDDFIQQKYSTSQQKITGSNDITPDSVVFQYAKDKLNQLAKSDKPFFMSIITANTHGPSFKFLEQNCEKKYNDARDNIKCFDKTVFDFVSWVQKQHFYKDTIIFLIGDHYMFSHNISKMKFFDSKVKSRVIETFNVVLDGSNTEPQVIHKKFTQIDWAPTMLESAGFKLKPRRLGLGVSLWSNEKTLLERFYSIENLKEKLKESEPFIDDFFMNDIENS